MKDANQEIIKRVLSNVLNRLESAGTPEAAEPSQKIAEPKASESSPVIFIVLNNAAADRGEDERNLISASAGASEQPQTFAPGADRKIVSHPGLERFASVEMKPDTNAPKTCFMEPDRICVNSGACEMRGF